MWKNTLLPVLVSFGGLMKGSFPYFSIDSTTEEKILLNFVCVCPQLSRRWKSKVVMLRKSKDFVFCL